MAAAKCYRIQFHEGCIVDLKLQNGRLYYMDSICYPWYETSKDQMERLWLTWESGYVIEYEGVGFASLHGFQVTEYTKNIDETTGWMECASYKYNTVVLIAQTAKKEGEMIHLFNFEPAVSKLPSYANAKPKMG